MAESPLKILQVCSAREAIYGAVQSLMTLAHEQRKVGHRVEFLTFAGKRFGAQVSAQGFVAHEVRVRGKVDPFAILKMRRVMLDGHFDVVHTHLSTSSTNGGLAARLAKIPSVATVHGMSAKLSFAAMNHLIAVSNGVQKHLVDQGVPSSRVSVVYNGIEVGRPALTREEARHQLHIPEVGLVAGTIARISPAKGIEDAIQAVHLLSAEFPELQYVVFGDGESLESCQALAASLNVADRVHFAGYRENVREFLPALDLFLFPSHKEAMGIALIEGMAAGLPVVSTDVGGIPEVVTPETGYLIPAHAPEEMAKRAAELLRDASQRSLMGEAGRRRVSEQFSTIRMELDTRAVYQLIAGRR